MSPTVLGVVIFGFDVGVDRLVLGTFTGMVYGLLAVGLVLVYRSSRFINFAQGGIGVFGASILSLLVVQHGVPYWAAFVIAIAIAAAVGGVTEAAIVRRLSKRPRFIGMIATLGLGEFILILGLVINAEGASGFTFPRPPGLPTMQIGRTPIDTPYVAMLILAPVLLVALAAFLTRSRHGLAIRAAADDPDGASLEGVNTPRMSTLSWAIAGAIAGFSAMLVTPTQGAPSVESLGPHLLLRGLVGAVIGRMTSLPIAFGASIGIGVLEQVLLSRGTTGLVEISLLVVILAALLLQPKLSHRGAGEGGWLRLQPATVPAAFEQLRTVRALPYATIVAGAIVAVSLAYLVTNDQASVLTSVVGFALVGASVVIVTGMGGQLSLGQFGYAGIGAAISVWVSTATGNFALGVIVGCLGAALASIAIGIPALRLRGLALAVTTLAFALASSAWLLRQSWMLGNGTTPPKPVLDGVALELAKDYYLFALLALAIGYWVAWNVRRGGVGRLWFAIRDNEDAAKALGIRVTRRKLQMYAVSGAIAGLGGVVIGHSASLLNVNSFPVVASIDVVALAVVGGLGFLLGPLLGAMLIVGLPGFLNLDIVGQAALTLAWLLAVILLPGGLSGLTVPLRDRIVDRLARRAGIDVDAVRAEEPEPARPLAGVGELRRGGVIDRVERSLPPGSPLLQVRGFERSFGGVRAVQGIDLDVAEGEILGIIGPNGAGKTTFFEMLAGFTTADRGSVVFEGQDVSELRPEQRARRGMVRSFQDARLFGTATLRETVMVAGEQHAPTNLWASLVGASRNDRRKGERADELLEIMGLTGLADRQVRELSTGTRRVAELTCLLALEPRLLLLDEPSAGIAQGESAALGELLRRINTSLGTTLVVIEHDLPLITSLADRLVAMELGRVIADGDPEEVCAHPAVVRSYLGDDRTAIARSEGIGTNGDDDGRTSDQAASAALSTTR